MIELILLLIGIYLIYLLVQWFVGAVGSYYAMVMKPVILGIGVITVIWVLIAYIRAYYTVLSDRSWGKVKEDSKEPAYLSYFAHQGFKDYLEIIKIAWLSSVWCIIKWGTMAFLWQFALGCFAIVVVPFTIPFFIGALVAVGISTIPFALFSVLHTVIMLVSLLITLVMALFLNIVERVSMLWRRMLYVCPHSGCYKRISLPIYVCPNCGAWHKKLIPGIYGVFSRRCQCGTMLPASSLNGRKRLNMVCPNSACNKPLHTSIGSAPSFHYAVLGEPSSGKTSYLYSLIYSMLNISQYDWFSIKDDNSKKTYQIFSNEYHKGIPPLKTVQKLPDSLILESSPKVGSGLFYFYDPAGEYFLSDAETMNQGEYQQYLDGLFFVIDPFSLPSIRAKCTQEELIDAGAAAGEYHSVYERLINYMRATYNEKLLQRIPVSVIISKADLIHKNPKFRSPIYSFNETQLSDWLMQNGLEQIIAAFSTYFTPSKVKYFAISAFGRSPVQSAGVAFRPTNVMAPFSWLLTNNSINPETGSMTVLKAKSEFVGNTLGFAVASLLFYFTASLTLNQTSLVSKKISKDGKLNLATEIVYNNMANKIISYVAQKRVLLNTNPDYFSFPSQKGVTIQVNRPTRFYLKGTRTSNPNHLQSDKLFILNRNGSLEFDLDNVSLGKKIGFVSDTYEVKTSFDLNPGEYYLHYLPVCLRWSTDLKIKKKTRQEEDLWNLSLWSHAKHTSYYFEHSIQNLEETKNMMEAHWVAKNLQNNKFVLNQSFLRKREEQKPVLYTIFIKITEDETFVKTVIMTFSDDLGKIVNYKVTDGATMDLDWTETSD